MFKQKKWFFLLLLIVSFCLLQYDKVKPESVNAATDNTIKVFSVLPEDLTKTLLNDYQKKSSTKFGFKFVSKEKAFISGEDEADLVIASRETMIDLSLQKRLLKQAINTEKRLQPSLSDVDGQWVGVCYDPCVFLINYSYSRRIGQKNLLSWESIAKQKDIVISMEDLSETPEMRYFLSAFVSKKGETEAFAFLKNVHNKIPQYAKFAISPIRLTTIGEADLAITSRNKVIKYIGNDFPAYMIEPAEGYPAKVFSAGIGAASTKAALCQKFINWLAESDDAAVVTEKLGYGYVFLSQKQFCDKNNKNLLWLNEKYLDNKKQTELVDKWLQNVRFAYK